MLQLSHLILELATLVRIREFCEVLFERVELALIENLRNAARFNLPKAAQELFLDSLLVVRILLLGQLRNKVLDLRLLGRNRQLVLG